MHLTPGRPSPAPSIKPGLARYRWTIALRSIAAVGGGYVLAAASADWLGRLLPILGMSRLEAVATATMLAFIVQACAAIWVFAVASTRRAIVGIVLPAAVMALGAWAVGGAA